MTRPTTARENDQLSPCRRRGVECVLTLRENCRKFFLHMTKKCAAEGAAHSNRHANRAAA
jgi:hypothetical protein